VAKFKLFLESSCWKFVNHFVGRVINKEFYELSRIDWDGEIAGKIKYSVLDGVVEIVDSSEIYGDLIDLFRGELERLYAGYEILGMI
jgi:hypothetical protein